MGQPFCNNQIKPGDTVLTLRDMFFVDNTKHTSGQKSDRNG